jgi:hypothetical protein
MELFVKILIAFRGLALKKITLTLIATILILLAGCKNNEPTTTELQWFNTKDKAIENGLINEGINRSSVLSSENVNDETIIFYEGHNALGVASIAESPKGYSWYRSQAYTGFQGQDVPYMTVGFDFQTYKGLKIKIIAGKIYDNTIQKMLLKGDGSNRELLIYGDLRLFFSVHEAPFNRLEVVPVRGI